MVLVNTEIIEEYLENFRDMYYISQVFEFNTEDVTRPLEESGRELGDFDGFLSRIDDLKHSYNSDEIFDIMRIERVFAGGEKRLVGNPLLLPHKTFNQAYISRKEFHRGNLRFFGYPVGCVSE